MDAECWLCGKRESFESRKEFIEKGWSRTRAGDIGGDGYGRHIKNGQGRDYCPKHDREEKMKNIRKLIEVK